MSLVGAACGGGGDDAGSPADTSTTEPVIAADDDLRLNEIQVIGTHNSFRVAPHPDEFALLEAMNPAQAAERTYSHRSITDQLAGQNVRQLELDIFLDAEGGLYSEPALRSQAGFPPLKPAFLRLYIHQHDVRPHAAYPAPGNDVIILSSQQAKKPAGARHQDGYNVSRGNFHTGIGNKSQPPPVGNADDLFAVQFREFCGHKAALPTLTRCSICAGPSIYARNATISGYGKGFPHGADGIFLKA